jgi:hypothetical protein
VVSDITTHNNINHSFVNTQSSNHRNNNDGIIGSALPWDKFTTMAGLNLLKGYNPALFIYSSIILFSLVQK